MIRQKYQRALAKIAWGYILICFDINFGVNGHAVSILPKWAGFLLILMALDGVSLMERSAAALKPIGLVLTLEAAIGWCAALIGLDWNYPWIQILIILLNLYFQFQLLTNLADIAQRSSSAYSKSLRILRTVLTVILTLTGALELLPDSWQEAICQHPALLAAAVCIQNVAAFVLCITLFCYKKEQTWDLELPAYVERVLASLQRAGHEAFVVGGCVRDSLMGKRPADWDVCTSALPEETTACFGEKETIPTGVKHGTVTVLTDGHPVEVTTYRIDGDYLDGRHPSEVAFTRSLEEDLRRRDFTMNAIAYSPSAGPVDVCGGREDIGARLIRCVGDPQKRFEEDALRILRALRFKAVLGFMLDGETARAVRSCRALLEHISKERIQSELSKLVMGDHADSVLKSYGEVLQVCVPEFRDVIKGVSVEILPRELTVRLAVLFRGGTKGALRALKYDNHTVKQASAIARLLDQRPEPPAERAELLRLLRDEGRETVELYFAAADAIGSGAGEVSGRNAASAGASAPSASSASAASVKGASRGPASLRLQQLLAEDPCYRLDQLAVSGGDLIQMGMKPGPEIGRLLKEMLELVIDGKLENNGGSLFDYAKERGAL